VTKTCLVMGYKSVRATFENPTQYLAEAIDGSILDGVRVAAVVLPPDSRRVGDAIAEAFERHRPEIALATGRARVATGIQVERTAVNVLDFPQSDTAGQTWSGAPVVKGGPAAYFASVPVKAMVAAVRAAGVPSRISNSASTHMCNQAMYLVLHLIEKKGLDCRGGFIHVPNLPEHVAHEREWGPTMSLETTVKGVRAAIEAAAAVEIDEPSPLQQWEW
jgi:pyroglutamyl-peptidase